jgi:aquaporin NIP
VLAGCAAINGRHQDRPLGHVDVAISFGPVILAMIYTLGRVSGAHFNLAVSSAFGVSRHFPWPRTFAYWGAQL